MKKRLSLLFILVTLGLAACYPQVPGLEPTTASRSEENPYVILFGDSLSGEADLRFTPRSRDQIAAAGYNVSYNAYGGTGVEDWFQRMDTLAVSDQAADATVIMALGTNDTSHPPLGQETMAQVEANVINALNKLSGVRCVVWLTLNATSGYQRGEMWDTARFNSFLRNTVASGQYHNLVLQNWEGTSYNHPEWLRDNIHHTATGNQQYVNTLIDAPNRCV